VSPEHTRSAEPLVHPDDLRPILERALQIDARRSSPIPLSELQRIGEEIGISPESISRAVAELKSEEAGRAIAVAKSTRRLKAWAKTAALGAAALLGGLALGHQNDVASLWLFVLTLLAALYYRRVGKGDDYLRDMIMVAGGFGAGWFVASGMQQDPDTIWHLIVPGLAGILPGLAIVHRKEVLRFLLGRESDGTMR
jgi:DNA-binding Lrp family transcriptional regulator